jgi:hypothetical protein
MALDAAELFVPGNGSLYVADVGTTAPTDASTALDSDFAELGYITEDGATITPSMDVTAIGAWQSFYAVRRVITARDLQVACALEQWNEDTLALYFGGATVTGSSPDFTISPPSPETIDDRAFVLEGTDGTRIYRLYVPSGMLIETAAITWSRSAAATLGVTIGLLATGTGDAWTLFNSDSEFPGYPDGA